MEFGDWRRFGIECCIEHAMFLLPDRMSSAQGRIRVWLDGVPVGSLDEWGVVISSVEDELVSLGADDNARWHPSLAQASPRNRHHALNLAYFGVEHPSLDSDERLLEAARSDSFRPCASRASILTNSAESFDGWNVFVLEPPGTDELHWTWTSPGEEQVATMTTSLEETRAIVAEFVAWLHGEQASWSAAESS